MKYVRAISLLLLLLHAGALAILSACFVHDASQTHSHAADHAHDHDPLPESEQHNTLQCGDSLSMAFSGRSAERLVDRYAFIPILSDVFLTNLVTVQNSLPESPPASRSFLAAYLAFSVLRI